MLRRTIVWAALFAVAAIAQPAKERMVVVVSLDGFPAFALDDPKAPVPTLRRLIAEGATARMTTINPTVTWPNHTTMVTGVGADRHGLLVNGSLVPTGAWPPVKLEPRIEQPRMVHAPTVYEAAHKAGLTTAQVDWVAIENAPAITWAFKEWASPDGPLEREMIGKGVIAESDVRDFTRSNILFRDQVWTKAAVHLIREHKPNLLLVHFLSLDTTHHHYGPNTLAATSTMAFLDSCVSKIVDAVRDSGMLDRTTFLIVADHGFKAYTKQIRPSLAFDAAGLSDSVYVIPEGGAALVYLKPGVPDLAARAMKALEGAEGLDRIIQPAGYAELGLPTPDSDPQMSQLWLTAKPGYAFSGAKGGPVTAEAPQVGGSHGYVASDPDMDALFIASGYGIQRGAKLDRISNLEIAPTIAKLLGVELPTAKSKPLPALAR
jgi:arylsulfatase A-like enzyme